MTDTNETIDAVPPAKTVIETIDIESPAKTVVIQEHVRREITIYFVIGYLFLIFLCILPIFPKIITVNESIDLIKTVTSVLGGIIGAVIGYYYRNT